jgi:hypothetical protein
MVRRVNALDVKLERSTAVTASPEALRAAPLRSLSRLPSDEIADHVR